MGVPFRSEKYTLFVRLGWLTIKDGEAAAVWNRCGVHNQVVGPKRMWLFNSTVCFLTRHKAESHQYLQVKHRDGRVENINGPTSFYENPALHDNITVLDGIRLESNNDCIIVYRGNKTGKSRRNIDIAIPKNKVASSEAQEEASFEKRVVRGPTFFRPSKDESIHEFNWFKHKKFHVLQTNRKYRMKMLKLAVTTSDAVKFHVVLRLNYRVESLDTCVGTKDPIKKMIVGVTADALVLGNDMTSDQLRSAQKKGTTLRLSRMDNYPFLCQAANLCGLRIDSIQVLVFKFPPEFQRQLEKDHQAAAAISTELTRKTKNHELREMELEDRHNHIEQEGKLKREEAKVDALTEEETHATKIAALERHHELFFKEQDAKQRVAREKVATVIEFLKALKEAEVDLTEFLCSPAGTQVAADVLSRSSVSESATLQKTETPSVEKKF